MVIISKPCDVLSEYFCIVLSGKVNEKFDIIPGLSFVQKLEIIREVVITDI